MAQKVQTLFIDDIDGGEAEGTVRFGLEGTDYEIDLGAAHTAELRQALATYITHSRKVGGVARRAPRRRRGASDIDTTAARAWAKEQGLAVNLASPGPPNPHSRPGGSEIGQRPTTGCWPLPRP